MIRHIPRKEALAMINILQTQLDGLKLMLREEIEGVLESSQEWIYDTASAAENVMKALHYSLRDVFELPPHRFWTRMDYAYTDLRGTETDAYTVTIRCVDTGGYTIDDVMSVPKAGHRPATGVLNVLKQFTDWSA